jgi:uncharacterized membrane protein YphA (DoxX/SURF4 family)
MAIADTLHPSSTRIERHTATQADPAYYAFWLLRLGFGVLPIVVGIDKYFDNFVEWKQYLWVGVTNNLNISPTTFMHIAGAIEIAAGLLVLFAPRVGSILVAAWLSGIVVNLLLVAHDEHEYWDIALRDAGLAVGAVALALLAWTYEPSRRPEPGTIAAASPS